jgi:site-specific recombinase XerD
MNFFIKPNFVNQKYLLSQRNLVFCADITIISPQAYLFLVLDLSSRIIVGHKLQAEDFSSIQIIQVLNQILIARKAQGFVLHTDNAQIFRSEEFHLFAKQHQITLSAGPQAFHQNQVIERVNRTIKAKLKKAILAILIVGEHLNFYRKAHLKRLVQDVSQQVDFAQLVNQTIEEYNNTAHKGERMFRMSPFNMDEALYNEKDEPQAIEGQLILAADLPLVANDNSPQAIKVSKYRAEVVSKFAGNWLEFFLDWERRNTQALEGLAQQNKGLAQQNRALYEQNRKLLDQVDYLVNCEKQKETLRAMDILKREKRKNAKKQPIRSAITPEEFTQILGLTENVYSDIITRARVRIALAILYCTGIRITNLLLLSYADLQNLINTGECQVSFIKGGIPRGLLHIGAKGQALLRDLASDIFILEQIAGKPANPIFSNRLDTTKPMSKTNLKEQVNKVLLEASKRLQKHIRSHSFRATFVTDLLDNGVPIEKAKDILGHRDIGTTATYRRSNLSLRELKHVIASLNKKRELAHRVPERTERRQRTKQKEQKLW